MGCYFLWLNCSSIAAKQPRGGGFWERGQAKGGGVLGEGTNTGALKYTKTNTNSQGGWVLGEGANTGTLKYTKTNTNSQGGV